MDLEGIAAARADERDALEAIFADDFVVLGDAEWLVRVPPDGQTVLRVVLPEGYPFREPPKPSIDCDTCTREFLQTLSSELLQDWSAGEVCVYQMVQHVQEALESQDSASGAIAAKSEEAAAAPVDQEVTGSCCLPIEVAVAEAVGSSLLAAGFANCGPGIYVHQSRGVTVEAGEDLMITVDGVDTEDLEDWVKLQLEDMAVFGGRLLEWVTAQRSGEGFAEDADEPDEGGGLQFLPSPEELHVTKDRSLLIYTWGKALRKAAPFDSQFNFNACVLNGRGGGADIRTQNGTSEEVQNNVASCGLFPRWLEMVISKIENANLQTVSVNCTKGRHRSVAAAELLKKLYYTKAVVKHLTIY
eukprot:gnl/TRDRNA2_/TRDRNA2_34836_c0_seq1.p1 gnl/TRDRNA2_/TRDRNA2_34836_c0~~gnl/TRDRNA2_/TRDRNA2_34836_c0_seq1.p1  ORF type:complete len:358 (+),score=62.39 gnl/TRDRNA2_/TRDRNA2_34836_c0_seq1:84-1157(+)